MIRTDPSTPVYKAVGVENVECADSRGSLREAI